MQLKDKIVIVTGASDGLGKALTTKLVGLGATVLGIARTKSKLDSLAKDLGEKFIPYSADLCKTGELNAVYDKILSEYPVIDILVNNAAKWHEGDHQEHNLDTIESLLMTNIFSVMGSTFKIYPVMKEQKKGQILNVNSTAGVDICPEWSPYSGTKYAITGYTKGLYQEAAKHNVKVMQIHPGGMDTSLFESFKEGYGNHDRMMDKDRVADIMITMLSQPEDMIIDSLVVRKVGQI